MSQDPLRLLESYVAREGHALVPKSHVESGFALGQWVAKRRFAYQQSRVDPERSSRLEELPGWSWAPQDDRWRHTYSLLLRFVGREGHAFVRQDVVEDGRRLGVWVWEQRRAYKRGRLSPERAALLGDLPGWVWDATAPRWDHHYSKLVSFVARTGHARVPHRHVEGGAQLGQWVQAQRKFHRRGVLRDERVERLERLPGWSWGSKRVAPTSAAKSTRSSRLGRPARTNVLRGDRCDWIDLGRAADLCSLSKNTIRRFIETGELPASKQDGAFVRIRSADIEGFVERHRVGARMPDAHQRIEDTLGDARSTDRA